MIRLVSRLGLCGILLGCSGTTSTGAPPPPPTHGLPTAPPTVSAETPPGKKECSCKLKLNPSKTPPAAAPAPISGDLPQGPFDLERRSACTAPLCKLDGFVPDPGFLQTTHEGVPSQGAVWLETIADQSVVETPAADGIDALALVLEGSVLYGEGEAKKATSPALLETWGTVRAPGAGYFLKARGGRASVLMVVTARSGTLTDAVQRARKAKPNLASDGRRLEPLDFATMPKTSWGGGAYHARVAFVAPGPSLTLIQATGGGSIPENVHTTEWEHISILRGSGDMLLGEAKYPVRDGAVFHVPRGVVHGWNGSGKELAAVLVFSPAGPEQRFLQLGAAK